MAQTYQARRIASGLKVDYTPGTAVGAGSVVVQSSLVGFAETDIVANALGSLAFAGLFDVVKINGAITAGTALYWDLDGNPQGGVAGSGAITTTSGDGDFCGFATAAATDTAEVVRVLLVQPVSVSIQNQLDNVITDPGDAGAIPVTIGGSVSIVTAGVETRTIADPTLVGQVISIAMKTDGGTCTITAASPIDQTGRTTIVLDTTGDVVVLIAVEDGADIEWRILADDTTAAQYNNLADVLTDPGDAGAIPVTRGGHVPLVTAGAETRTLADPTFMGQQLLLAMKTDGGNCVVTAATAVNEAGNNTITFDNPGETLLLVAIESDATLVWRVVLTDAAALSTV